MSLRTVWTCVADEEGMFAVALRVVVEVAVVITGK